MCTSAQAAASSDPRGSAYPGRWLAAVVMAGAVLMDMIDITIINVALPTIGRDLEASGTQLEWVVSAYMLAFAAALIVAGTSATSSVASASSSAISGSAGVLWGYTAPVPRLPR